MLCNGIIGLCLSIISTIISVSPKFEYQMQISPITNIIITEQILVMQLSASIYKPHRIWTNTNHHNPNGALDCPHVPAVVDV